MKPVEILMSSDRQIAARIIHFCFRSMNEPVVQNSDLCAYYAIFIVGFAPGLRDAFIEALTHIGYTVTVREGDENHPLEGIELTGAFEYSIGLLYFGQCILLLFKNISTQGYEIFMKNRITAMRAFVGVPKDTGVSLILPRARAAKIRSMMGSKQQLRIKALNFLIAASRLTQPFGALSGYLCNILSWTDMTGILMVKDALLVPNSPVVTDVRVANEVRNVAKAIAEINSCTNPQFFGLQQRHDCWSDQIFRL